MTDDEARFILRSHRMGTEDDRDPVFADALAHTAHDPELSAWLESEHAFDAAVTGKLNQLQPDAGSVEAILAGVRASRHRRNRWRPVVWLAAAAVAVLLTLAATLRIPTSPPDLHPLTRFALADTTGDMHGHLGVPANLDTLARQMSDGDLREVTRRLLELGDLRASGCRIIRVAGRDVFELCFGNNHEFHLYIARRDDFRASAAASSPLVVEQGRLAAATWADDRHVYSLVTAAGTDALRRVL